MLGTDEDVINSVRLCSMVHPLHSHDKKKKKKYVKLLVLRPQKRKPCFTGATDPDFPFWEIFFF